MKKLRRGAAALAAVLMLWGTLLPGTASAAPAGATVWGYSEGLALCELDGKWGYVNPQREVVIPIQYHSAVSFSLGMAAVNLDGKLGVIRPDGKYLIEPEYDSLVPLDCGLYIAQKGGLWGVVSVLPLSDGKGGKTNVVYEFNHSSAKVVEQGGVQVLTLEKGEEKTKVPLFDLPGILAQRGMDSAQFPLSRGKLPSFTDVSPGDWFDLWVDLAYNVGLISGVGGGRYAPDQTLTVAEALQLAATMDSRYKDDDFHLRPTTGTNWYSAAVDYCTASGIIKNGEFAGGYTRAVTRGEMARIFAATSLAKEMPTINRLSRVRQTVPDVTAATPYAEAIYSMYAKGVLSGVDGNFTFRPGGTVTRAEAAAIVSRMARAEQRLTLWD